MCIIHTVSRLITIIVPTYRRPNLLRRAIFSALSQTYPHIRVCIYDNASGDETAEVVRKIVERDSRVEYYCHPENIGAAENFRFGMARINTEFFLFLSDDDVLLPGFCAAALQGFDRFPEIGFFAGSVLVMTERGEVLAVPFENWRREGYFAAPQGLLDIIGPNLPIWTGVLFRSGVIERVGLLDMQVMGPIDLDFLLRVAAHFPFFVSGEPGAIFVSHPHSHSTAGDIKTLWPGWLKLTDNIVNDSAIPIEVRQAARAELKDYVTKSIFSLATKSALRKDREACFLATRALREELGSGWRAFFIEIVVRGCAIWAPICLLLNALAKMFRFAIQSARRKPARLQYKYGVHARWLYEYGKPDGFKE